MNERFSNGPEREEGNRSLSLEMAEQIPKSGDYTEEIFLDVAVTQGLLVTESEMITLSREKMYKGDKLSTVPDFIVKKELGDEGIYVEVTENNSQDAHKNRQYKVMQEAGLGNRYVQLTCSEIEGVRDRGDDLYSYIKLKIRE